MNERKTVTNRKDLTGKRFGRLIVIEYAYTEKKRAYWRCKCDCGNEIIVRGDGLKCGAVKSCRCLIRELNEKRKRGKFFKKIYKVWFAMKDRCFNKNNPSFKNYGLRGITICNEWMDINLFYQWATNNGYNPNLTIERINVNGDYQPLNCRWATSYEQVINRTNTLRFKVEGEILLLTEIAKRYNIKYKTLYRRLSKGCDIEKAIGMGAKDDREI